ncbi:hypothetical protein HOU03_gp446 [Caulobacter phage CcrSC]|uniref:Uncharacterized protein n=1 Tax=Caulobacter phage CcrSC TaxID=2283272 RepID=A0A385EFZ4_9CAUD|nr:hypothetical protein HOU03_gp446 [Caulobacter phage CcrSC]AXQ69822.1 hypothetical protein CcrSC_gp240c [Caulobacter phage CcrSC]
MKRVFDVRGAFGTMEQAGEAFNAMLMRLAMDPDVRSIKSEVLTDGIHENMIFGPQPKITGYTIDVEYLDIANDK